MGGILSLILADLIMNDRLDWIHLSFDFDIKLVKKYVDDIFLIIKSSQLQVEYLISIHHPLHISMSGEDYFFVQLISRATN